MNDLQLLFLVLAVLYLWECLNWLPPRARACISWLGKRSLLIRPGQFFGNQQGGIVFAPPLPPLGNILVGHPAPFALSPQGVSITGKKGNAVFLFANLKTIEAKGHKLCIDGAVAMKLPTHTFAIFAARQLRDLKDEKPDRRAAAIQKFFQSQFDTKTIEARWEDFRSRSSTIRWLANGLFVYLFAVAPLMIARFGLVMTWPSLVVGLLAFTSSLAITCYRVHKHFFPAAEDDRFTHAVTVLLAPATTIRARDHLSRRLLETFHPLALALVFCPAETFRTFAERTLRDLRYSVAPASAENKIARKEVETFSREAELHAVENFLRRNKTDPDDLCAAPKREETCNSYCPRCLTQFTTANGQCADCGGIQLISFGASTEKKQR